MLGIKRLFFMGLLWFSSACFSSPLIVGIAISGLPLVQKVATEGNSYYFGFCIDLMNNICKNIGQSCDYRNITLDNQFELLNEHKIDLLMLASPYTPFGLEQYAVSMPYTLSKIQFVGLENSPIDEVKEIKNKKIGVMKQTFYSLLSQSVYSNNNKIIPYNTESDLMSSLAQHQVDVVVLNSAIAYILASNNIYQIKLIGKSIPLGEGYGIIGLPDKAALIDEISKAILLMENNGVYASIYSKYFPH